MIQRHACMHAGVLVPGPREIGEGSRRTRAGRASGHTLTNDTSPAGAGAGAAGARAEAGGQGRSRPRPKLAS